MGTAAGTSHGSCNTTGRSCWGGWLRASSRTARITRGGKRTACLPRIRCQEGGGTTGCLGRGGWYGAPSRSACLPPRLGEWAPRRHLATRLIGSNRAARLDAWAVEVGREPPVAPHGAEVGGMGSPATLTNLIYVNVPAGRLDARAVEVGREPPVAPPWCAEFVGLVPPALQPVLGRSCACGSPISPDSLGMGRATQARRWGSSTASNMRRRHSTTISATRRPRGSPTF